MLVSVLITLLFPYYHVPMKIWIFFVPLIFSPYFALGMMRWPELLLLDLILYPFNETIVYLIPKKDEETFSMYFMYKCIRRNKVLTGDMIKNFMNKMVAHKQLYMFLYVFVWKYAMDDVRKLCCDVKDVSIYNRYADSVNATIKDIEKKTAKNLSSEELDILWCCYAFKSDKKHLNMIKEYSKKNVKLWDVGHNLIQMKMEEYIKCAGKYDNIDLDAFYFKKNNNEAV